MKSYIKVLKTKREIAELIVIPLCKNLPGDYKVKVIDKLIQAPEKQFMKDIRLLRELDIVPFINNHYFIRYEIV